VAERTWTDDELDQAIADQPEGAVFGEEARSRTLSMMLHALDVGEEPVVRGMATTSRSRKRWFVAAAVVPLVAGGMFAVQPLLSDGDKPAAAATVLQRAATAVSDDVRPGPGQYQYVTEHWWAMSSATTAAGQPLSAMMHSLTETWIPAVRSQEWLTRSTTLDVSWLVGNAELASAEGPAGMVDPVGKQVESRGPCGDFPGRNGELGGTPDDGKPCDERVGGWWEPRPPFLASLPRDPQALYDVLRTDAGGDVRMMLDRAVTVLESSEAPRDLRASLYLALRQLPGLEVTEAAANLDGRKGVALGVPGGITSDEVIIDPTTGRFIGERSVLREDGTDVWQGLKAGTVIQYSAVGIDVVDRVGSEP
jgi:hypothetical protein